MEREFELIVPCGIRDKGVTSLQRLLGPTLAFATGAFLLTLYVLFLGGGLMLIVYLRADNRLSTLLADKQFRP